MTSREDVTFDSGGERIAAWLYRPNGSGSDGSGPARPIIVMAHGLAAVKEMRLDAYAERFAAAGYACLVFDYRNFGASGGEPRQLLDANAQLADWAAAVRYAKAIPGIDRDRVALWGTSFAGGHVIATAAKVPGIAAVVAQCPFTDGIASSRTVNPLTIPRVTALAVRDTIAGLRGRPPVMVPAAGRPGEAALMNAPDVYEAYLKLMPEGLDVPVDVAARFAMRIIAYRPGRLAAKVPCPILFCVCQHDSVAPARTTLRYAAKAPRGEVKLYPVGHFDIYLGAAFERAVADQIDFFDRQLTGS